jgi:hypothetical protein
VVRYPAGGAAGPDLLAPPGRLAISAPAPPRPPTPISGQQGIGARNQQEPAPIRIRLHPKTRGIYRLKATVLSHLCQEGSPRIRPPSTAAAASARERFLQLAGDFVGRGLHVALHDLDGLGKRLVESLFDGWLADRDEPGLVSGELLGGLVELLAGQGPAAEPLRDDADVPGTAGCAARSR